MVLANPSPQPQQKPHALQLCASGSTSASSRRHSHEHQRSSSRSKDPSAQCWACRRGWSADRRSSGGGPVDRTWTVQLHPFIQAIKNPVCDRASSQWLRFSRTERVGFEPTDAFTSLVFKTRAINHSTTSPYGTTQQLSSSTLEQCCWDYTIF